MIPLRALCCALFVFAATARAGTTGHSEPWPHEHSDVPPDPRVTWGRLDNGVRYAVRENHEPKGRVYLILRVHAGSLHERDDQLGYAHFVEHMLFNGTRRYPGATLVEELQREGLEFGADSSAFTNTDTTFYNLDLPGNSEDRIARGLGVLREFADGGLFDKAYIKSERGVIESERRTRETTATPASEELDHFLFPDSRMSRRLPIGTTASVEAATAPRLLEFYRTWYRPSRMTVIAVGDAPAALLARLVTDAFATLQPAITAELPEPVAGPFAADGGTRARYIRSPVEGGLTSMIYAIHPARAGGDTVANRRQQVQEAAGFWILNERLQDIIRANPVEFGQAQASWQPFRSDISLSLVRIDSRAALWRRGLRTGEQELRRALDFGFTHTEVAEQIDRFRNFYLEAIRMDPTSASGTIAHSIRASLDGDAVFSSAQTNWDLVADTVSHLQPDSCSEQFRSAWSPSNRRLALIGPKSVRLDEKGILSAYEESRAGFLSAQADAPAVPFDYTDFGPPGAVARRNHVEAIDTESVEFANRSRLNVKRTDFEAGRIYLRARFGRGLAGQPYALPGLGMLATSLVTHSGLMRHDVNELRRILAGTPVSLDFEVQEDACYFNGVADPASLETLFRLLAAYLTEPAYRFSAYQRSVGEIQYYYAEMAHDPVSYLHAVSPLFLADGNVRYGSPRIEDTLSRSPQQVQQWLDPQLRGDLEVGLVGDLDPEAAIAIAGRTIGALPLRLPAPALDENHRPRFPVKPVHQVFKVDTPESKAVVQVSWPGTDDANFHRDRRIAVLGEIINDRLRVKLREEQGITYAPTADSWGSALWPGYGYLYVEVIVAPRQVDRTADLIRRIADDIRQHGITDDEFNRAREPRLATLSQDLRKNPYWLYHVLDRLQERPDVAQMPLTREDDYRRMTRADIEATARECLGGVSCALIVRPK
ncbi:MAG TPA: insulinase family protein [Candidatus Didemnitutus sp.]|nr:insulinase family protein [Candidatus Didemnitutus sp.]